MLRPVIRTAKDGAEVIDFVHFEQDASAALGRPAKLVTIKRDELFKSAGSAMDAANMVHLEWMSQLKDAKGGLASVRPSYPQTTALADGWIVYSDFWVPSYDLPLGRTVQEAMSNPLDYAGRSSTGRFDYNGHEAVLIEDEDIGVEYARASTIEKRYKHLLDLGALKVTKKRNGRSRAKLTFWQLPQIPLPRDEATGGVENTQFDLWGKWHVEKNDVTIGATILHDDDEGSGRSMSR